MISNKTRQRRVLTLVVIVAVLTICTAVTRIYKSSSLTARAGVPAPAPKTLRERAETANGNHFKGYLGLKTTTLYQDVSDLAQHSSEVISGNVIRNVCHFGPTENSIQTDYVVSVTEVFKGSLKSGDKIVVTRPGGRVQLDDGSYAEVQVLFAGKHMMNKRKYVLFLTQRGDGYTSVGGPQGIFRIIGKNIEPGDGWPNHPVVTKYANMSTGTFLAQVRQAGKNQ
jgi:hypothetical protein